MPKGEDISKSYDFRNLQNSKHKKGIYQMDTKEKNKIEVIAKEVKSRYALDDDLYSIVDRIEKAIEAKEEAPAFKIDPDDQLTILGIMAEYCIYPDLTPAIIECLSAWLEEPDPEIFNMFDEINKETNYTSGIELLYYAKGARQ